MSTGAIVPTRLADFLRSVPYEISGQWFHQQHIQLDGYAFSQCRFDACTLYVARGIFKLSHCFMAGCLVIYNDEARNIARLFSGMHVPSNVQINPSLRPDIHPDGTFSIDAYNR
jgi:hypothetical protein